ncbi:MAG: DUF1186 domain-containing protein, partial [Ghiorsea sp.]|nr:DUF1186 domain-containing protein [Ghiorsea sp.]
MTKQVSKHIDKLFHTLTSVDTPPSKEDFIAMIENKVELTPLLLQDLDAFILSPSSIEDKGASYIRHILAIFLLAHFREHKAFDKLIQLISIEDKLVLQLTGEVFTEALGRLLASTF